MSLVRVLPAGSVLTCEVLARRPKPVMEVSDMISGRLVGQPEASVRWHLVMESAKGN